MLMCYYKKTTFNEDVIKIDDNKLYSDKYFNYDFVLFQKGRIKVIHINNLTGCLKLRINLDHLCGC